MVAKSNLATAVTSRVAALALNRKLGSTTKELKPVHHCKGSTSSCWSLMADRSNIAYSLQTDIYYVTTSPTSIALEFDSSEIAIQNSQ